jgi:hypothetical protein
VEDNLAALRILDDEAKTQNVAVGAAETSSPDTSDAFRL